MKKQLRVISILFVLCSLLCLAACGGASKAPEPTPEPTAVPTPSPTPEPVRVSLDGQQFDLDVTALDLKGNACSAADLTAALGELTAVESVRLDSCSFTVSEQLGLKEAFPAVVFEWPVVIDGSSFRSTDNAISLSGAGAGAAAELQAAAPLFDSLDTVDFYDSSCSDADLIALQTALPDTDVLWTMELCGQTLSTGVTEIDLSNIPFTDTAELERALPAFCRLEKVFMKECGLDNETMDALNNRWENVRFVWNIHVLGFTVPTDTIGFCIYTMEPYYGHCDDQQAFRYCTDMESVDFGHGWVSDISFFRSMPHLKYVILQKCNLRDWSPLGDCPELRFLEVLKSDFSDLAILLPCKELRELNISYCWGGITGDTIMEYAPQMPYLERLWISSTQMDMARGRELQALLPNTIVHMCTLQEDASFGSWRHCEGYYLHRDALGMYYMNEYGNTCGRSTPEELEKYREYDCNLM